MAELFAATGSTNLAAMTPTQWSPLLHHEIQNRLFFKKHNLQGEDTGDSGTLNAEESGVAIIQKTELNKNPGDHIKIGLMRELGGAGVYGATALTDAEVALRIYDMDIYVDLWRQGTAYTGFLNSQRNPFKVALSNLQRLALVNWMAQLLDNQLFYAFYHGWSQHVIAAYGGATDTAHPNKLYAGGASNDAGLTSECVMNAEMLERLATYAADNNINQVNVNGDQYWVLVIHPYQLHNLRLDTTLREDFRSAGVRGKDNPIFSGADIIFNNLIVFTTKKIDAVGSTGEDANKRKALLIGAHAMAQAIGRKPWPEDCDNTDFKLKAGKSINCIFGQARADFISDDSASTKLNQSSVEVHTYAKNPNP